MKKFYILLIILLNAGLISHAQDIESKKICEHALEIFQRSTFRQGTYASQALMDSLLLICPTQAIVWREKSVPYLKRGDYATWFKLISKAVELEPQNYLQIRGWCRIKFLHDYKGGLKDLERYDSLTPGRYKVVDDTHIKVWMGIANQQLNNPEKALKLFDEAIKITIDIKGIDWIGTYDFLYRAILKLQINDFEGAIHDLNLQIIKYDKLADAYYYRGLAKNKIGLLKQAKADFNLALSFYKQGYHIEDAYVRMPGQVDLEEIELQVN